MELEFDDLIHLKAKNGSIIPLTNFNFHFKPQNLVPTLFQMDNTSLGMCFGKANSMCAEFPEGMVNFFFLDKKKKFLISILLR